MADTPQGETATPEVLENKTATPTPPPQVKDEDKSAVEQLRKELEQAQMRANQLENKLTAKEEEEKKQAEAELAEQNRFKELYEQEKADKEALLKEQEETRRQAELSQAKEELFASYPAEVREVAEEASMELSDTDDATLQAFKEKLDKISAKVVTGKVTPNNPRPTSEEVVVTAEDIQQAVRTPGGLEEIVRKKYPGIASMMNQNE